MGWGGSEWTLPGSVSFRLRATFRARNVRRAWTICRSRTFDIGSNKSVLSCFMFGAIFTTAMLATHRVSLCDL
eukprot:1194826-Prorocentrum_minimum.AAC.1